MFILYCILGLQANNKTKTSSALLTPKTFLLLHTQFTASAFSTYASL